MRDRVTIAIIGAGSVVFSKGTIGDILLNETLTHYPIDLRLMDIVPGAPGGGSAVCDHQCSSTPQAVDGNRDYELARTRWMEQTLW